MERPTTLKRLHTTRPFAMGFSYGGGMSYAIACGRATVFRARIAEDEKLPLRALTIAAAAPAPAR